MEDNLNPLNGNVYHNMVMGATPNPVMPNPDEIDKVFADRCLWFAVLLSILLQVAVVYLPVLNRAFGATPLGLKDWGVAIGLTSIELWGEEVQKDNHTCCPWSAEVIAMDEC